MIQRLEQARELFSKADRDLEAAVQPFAAQHGITPDLERITSELMKREARDFP
jgi:hypothetical protein